MSSRQDHMLGYARPGVNASNALAAQVLRPWPWSGPFIGRRPSQPEPIASVIASTKWKKCRRG